MNNLDRFRAPSQEVALLMSAMTPAQKERLAKALREDSPATDKTLGETDDPTEGRHETII